MPIQCTCLTCSTPFTTKPAHIRRGRGKYCSRACQPRGRPIVRIPAIPSADGLSAEIPLTARNGSARAYAIVDAADVDWVNQWRWYFDGTYAVRMTSVGSRGQQTRTKTYLHRALLDLTPGDGVEGDHINLNKLDNRRSNLRVVTHEQQMQNQSSRRGSASAYRGVTWHKDRGKWVAQVHVGGKNHYLGLFSTEIEAAEAALEARKRLMPYATD